MSFPFDEPYHLIDMSSPLERNDDMLSNFGDTNKDEFDKKRRLVRNKVRINSRGTNVTDGEVHKD